jgi:prostaglandin-E synthase 1
MLPPRDPHQVAHGKACLLSTLLQNPDFRLYALCVCALSFLMLIIGAMTAAKRNTVKQFLNVEDAKVSAKDAKVIEEYEHPDVARVMRAHRNALESVPIFFATGLLYVLVGGPSLGAQICFVAFTVSRVLHAVVYIKALQPWRTMMFAVGLLSLTGMMVLILRAVLTA